MRDVSTTGGYVPFSIYKYMKKKHVSSFPVILRKRFMDNIPGFSGYYVSKRGRVYTWGTQSGNIQQCVKEGRHQSCKLDM